MNFRLRAMIPDLGLGGASSLTVYLVLLVKFHHAFHWCITEYSINRNCRHYLKRTDIILFWICVCHLLLFI